MKSSNNSLVFLLLLFISTSSFATEYYVNSKNGSDKNNGKSNENSWKSLSKVSKANLKPGDVILLANGQEFKGTIELTNTSGSKSKPIVITGYSIGNNKTLPIINAKNYLNGIKLTDCSHIKINGLTIIADGGKKPKKGMRCGIFYTSNNVGNYSDITIENCTIKNVFFENPDFKRGKDEVKSANGTQSYGWGIRFLLKGKKSNLKDVTVQNCTVSNVSHTGIKINGQIQNLKVLENNVLKVGGPGMQFSGITNGLVQGNNVNYSGSNDDSRKWGRGSGMWTWGLDTMLIEYNEFRNANGPADSAGCHIDFNCKNVIVQYNISENNAGGFAEILGNNWNCAYRYNVSINDGHRVKKKGVAFQEGKIFWLSGFVGKDRERHGPYNSYFYNNTIYVKSVLQAKMAVAKVASGTFIANNIFYIEGTSKAVLGDQYQPQEEGEATIENVIFKNNLFLKADNWPKGVLIQDESPVIGDPKFANAGGKEIKDYIPNNIGVVKNKGINIRKIPGDKKGLFIGVKVEKDILGNKIIGLPDMGAIEISKN